MQVYLVGGAVRDELLKLPVHEKDWVVVGETPENMLSKGYTKVGKDFPVFLHPVTKEEYALARTEKKSAPGYKGFVIHAEQSVTLLEDLKRRDLTINAIARDAQGQLIDPYGGLQDIEKGILRHVSPAFSEDPVRVLRLARFSARYQHLGFKIAPETKQLMQQMVIDGEIDALVAERVWAETAKALTERQPTAYFETLRECGALARVFPELNNLFGVPQPAKYHPEIDTGLHSLMTLAQASHLSEKPSVRFAALFHDLGKALTPQQEWPHHYNHEITGRPLLKNMCKRLRVPNDYFRLADQVMQYHTHCHKALELKASTLVHMLKQLGAFQKSTSIFEFLTACEADCKGRTGMENTPYPQKDFLLAIRKACRDIDISHIINKKMSGEQTGVAVHELRVHTIKEYKKNM